MIEPSPPAYHLGAVVTAHAGLSTILAVSGAFWLAEHMTLSPFAPVFSAAVVILSIIAAEPIRRTEQPLHFGHANRVTLFRAILVALVASLMGSTPTPEMATAASIVAIVALTLDGVDGWVARKTNGISDYGAHLDMELDSIFMLVLCVMVFDWEHAGAWVLFCGIARYAWIVTQSMVVWFRRPLMPAFRRKTACVIGVAGLSLALAPWPVGTINTVLAAIATLTLAISFSIDIIWLFRHRREPLS
jgi:phosphatidylglycerophosphate synthase